MEQQESKKQPIDLRWHPDAKIELTWREFEIMTTPLKAFEWALSITNNKIQQAQANKSLVYVYPEDCQQQDGKVLIDETRKPILKEGFWNKEENKTLTVQQEESTSKD